MELVGMERNTSDIADERQLNESDRPWALGLNDLKAKLGKAVYSPLTSGCCIYKVPPKLRKVNEEAYTPSVVSIGPYHYGDKRLESMQELKVWYVNRFLERNSEKSLEDYFKALKDQENEIRRCYSEIIQMNSDAFVGMVFTDACFIIEYFLLSTGLCAGQDLEDYSLVQKIWPGTNITLDLILLENQLPFFVLTCLFGLAFPRGFNGKYSFVKITFHVFLAGVLIHIYPSDREISAKFMNSFNYDQVQHLCDVLRICYLPSDPPPRKHCPTISNRSHSVSQLHEAGMKFQVDKKSIVTRLKYSERVLTIPIIVVNDLTETILRNVIAFEQCHCSDFGYVTDYVLLLDDFIDTGKDVEILVGMKIMENWLSDSNEVASMVNKLCKNVFVPNTNTEYISLYEEMDKFCENPYHKYKAIFVREYWSTPWKIASVIAATLLLFLTLIQTISSVISV